MNAQSGEGAGPRLRPMGIGEILDASLRIFKRNFKTLTLAVLVVALPVVILDTLIVASTVEGAFDLSTEEATIEDEGGFIAGRLVSVVLLVVAYTVATAACFHAVSHAYLGERVTWQQSLKAGARRMVPVIVLGLVALIAVVIGLILLLIPGIFLAVRWAVAIPAMLSENLGPSAALERSFGLVKGRWWATFATLILMIILVSVIQFVVVGGLIGLMFADSDNEVLVAVVQTIGNAISYAFTLPIEAAVFTLIYYDLRVRKEGFDLQLLAERMGGGTGLPAASAADSGLGSLSPENPTYQGGFTAPTSPAPPAPQPPTERE